MDTPSSFSAENPNSGIITGSLMPHERHPEAKGHPSWTLVNRGPFEPAVHSTNPPEPKVMSLNCFPLIHKKVFNRPGVVFINKHLITLQYFL